MCHALSEEGRHRRAPGQAGLGSCMTPARGLAVQGGKDRGEDRGEDRGHRGPGGSWF